MKAKKPKQPRVLCRKTVSFEKHNSKPPAIVEGKFTAPIGSIVYAWRLRGGQKPSWYPCEVIKVTDTFVELWDQVAGQWFCFDPSASETPDVRLSA